MRTTGLMVELSVKAVVTVPGSDNVGETARYVIALPDNGLH
jgi:hypothetical protein